MHVPDPSQELVRQFEQVLRLCAVAPGQVVLAFTDPGFPHLAYAPAAAAAAHALGAVAYVLVAHPGQDVEDRAIRAAWANTDLVLGMSFLPGAYSWMYSEMHSVALNAGTRVLMVQEPPEVLARLLPTEEARRRGLAGAQLLEPARTVRLRSAAGTDLTFRKEGRQAAYQCGVADVPGRWDHWPSGMVYCAPLEDSAEGTLVLQPGDVLLGLRRHAVEQIRLTFRGGRLEAIEGDADAEALRARLAAAGDEDAYRLGHAGWGTDPRADWSHVGMDSESLYGTVTLALGRNLFDSPAPYCGMRGLNRSAVHVDLCLRGVDVDLDGAPVIRAERFLPPDLA